MKRLNNFIKFIQTKEMIVLALLLSLVSQLSHSVFSYLSLSSPEGLWQSFFYVTIGLTFALGVSLSILILTLRGNMTKAYVYLGFEFLINLIYYKTYEVIFDNWIIAVVQVLFAFIMPYTIATYSEIISTVNRDEELKTKKELDMQKMRNDNILKQIEELRKNQKETLKDLILSDYEIEIGEKIGDRNFKVKLKSNKEE